MAESKNSKILRTFSNLEHAKKLLAEVQRLGIVKMPKTTVTNIDKGLKQVRPMIKFAD